MKYLTEQERRSRMDALMAGVEAKQCQKEEKPTVPELAENSVKLLITFALQIGITLVAAYEAVELHAAEGKRAIDDLLARGFVLLHRIARKGRGGQPIVVEITPSGRDELAKRGVTPAEKKLKRGGFKHDVYARYVEQWAKGQKYTVWFERVLGPKAFDVVYDDGTGVLRAIEVCLSGTVHQNAEQAIKGAEVEGVAEVVVACERKEFMSAIMKEVGEIDQLGLYRGKIMGKLLAEYVT